MSQFFASTSQNIGDFIYNIRPSNEYSGLISFGIYWFDLFEFQGTQESSTIPHFKSISSLAFSFLYSPTLTSIPDYWKNHSFDQTDLCWQSFLKMLSRLAISSLPQSKCLLISWLQSPSAVILEPPQIISLSLFPHVFAMK